jgi:hypothetical protein
MDTLPSLLQCKKCGFIAKTKKGLKQHRKGHWQETTKCTQTNRLPVLIVPVPENRVMQMQTLKRLEELKKEIVEKEKEHCPTGVIKG